MNNRKTDLCLGRVLLGFVISSLVATIVYAFISFGQSLFFPFVIFIAGGVLSATLLVFIPVYVLMVWKRWLKFWQILMISFVVGFTLYYIVFLFNDQSMNSMGGGGNFFVLDGELTFDGYVNLLQRSLLSAISATIASIVFWFVAHWNPKKKNKKRKGCAAEPGRSFK